MTIQKKLPSQAHYHTVRSFTALHSDITRMSLASWIEHQQALSFAYSSWKKCTGIAIILSPSVFISVKWTFDDALQCSRKNAHPCEKRQSIRFYPSLFFFKFRPKNHFFDKSEASSFKVTHYVCDWVHNISIPVTVLGKVQLKSRRLRNWVMKLNSDFILLALLSPWISWNMTSKVVFTLWNI